MKVDVTVAGIAARLAAARVARTREQVILATLDALAARERQRVAEPQPVSTPDNATTPPGGR